MDDNIVLQSLTESFEIIKDSWETKKEAIINCIVETEIYDGDLAMDMWLYILNKEGECVDKDGFKFFFFYGNKMEECIGDVFKAFVNKYEEFDLPRPICKVLFDHLIPYIIKNDKLMEILFEKSDNMGCCTTIYEGLYDRLYKNKFIPALLACVFLLDNPLITQKIMNHMINWDNSINWEVIKDLNLHHVSIGGLIRLSKEYIQAVYRNKEDFNKEYILTKRVKETLLSCLDRIKHEENRAECTIEILSL